LFDEARLTAERKRQLEFWKNWRYRGGRDDSQVGSGARSPLAFTGLVFAGVNGDPTQVLTGESLVALPLESLRLVVLSACQTGLGEWTAGEGVFGLTRAFHLAGCPNVVSSLWNINDAASAALMNKFYHELWVNHRTPIEALREAQLLVYRHPELIADLAGERGAPKLKEAIAFKAATTSKPPDSANTTGMKPVRSPTKLWAAFILSGVNNSAGW
jgi:CHAT domain-containing protein